MTFFRNLKSKKTLFFISTFFIITAIFVFSLPKRYKENQDSKPKPDLLNQNEVAEDINEGDPLSSIPQDFPVYNNASVSGSSKSSGIEGSGVSIIWESSDDSEKIHSFYRDELDKNGWEIVKDERVGNFYSLSFKKDSASGFLGITKSLKKTILSVTMRY